MLFLAGCFSLFVERLNALNQSQLQFCERIFLDFLTIPETETNFQE